MFRFSPHFKVGTVLTKEGWPGYLLPFETPYWYLTKQPCQTQKLCVYFSFSVDHGLLTGDYLRQPWQQYAGEALVLWRLFWKKIPPSVAFVLKSKVTSQQGNDGLLLSKPVQFFEPGMRSCWNTNIDIFMLTEKKYCKHNNKVHAYLDDAESLTVITAETLVVKWKLNMQLSDF